MARKIYTDQQLLDYSGEHLLYELQMLHLVALNLPKDKSFLTSALLESFAIHLRNLTDFFYTGREDARGDDLIAADFCDPASSWDPGPMPQTLRDAKDRANKEVSHITYKRKDASDPAKPWPVGRLASELNVLAQRFAAVASDRKLHPNVRQFLQAAPQAQMVMIVNASTQTSNVAIGTFTSPPRGGSGSGNRST